MADELDLDDTPKTTPAPVAKPVAPAPAPKVTVPSLPLPDGAVVK